MFSVGPGLNLSQGLAVLIEGFLYVIPQSVQGKCHAMTTFSHIFSQSFHIHLNAIVMHHCILLTGLYMLNPL
jgi:hypothetical protein